MLPTPLTASSWCYPAKPPCPFPSHPHWLVTVPAASRPSRGQLPQQRMQQLKSLKSYLKHRVCTYIMFTCM